MQPSKSIQPMVFIVDDDPGILADFDTLLSSVRINCETYQSADEFLEKYSPRPASCLVLDIRLPGMSGLELQQKLNDMHVKLPIIMITGYADVEMAVTAMRHGAFDFIEKPFRDQVLLNSINSALAAGTQSQIEEHETSELVEKWRSLTTREREVAELVVSGKPNKVSAYELGVSQRTIEIHRARVMRKLSARSLADLVRMSLQVEQAL